jgi:hypothetical protein
VALTMTSQLSASEFGVPDKQSSFHESQGGRLGDPYCTGRLGLAFCGSQIRGVHDQRRPMYAMAGGWPANRRRNARNFHVLSLSFLASMLQMWLPLDLVFLPSSL